MYSYKCIIRVRDGLSFDTVIRADNEAAVRMIAEATYGPGKLAFYTRID